MLYIKIISGTYGYRAERDGEVEPKAVGDICCVEDTEVDRLVSLGVAEIVGEPNRSADTDNAATDSAEMGDDETDGTYEDDAETRDDADNTEIPTKDELMKMSKAELLSRAIDLGIEDMSNANTKSEIADAILAMGETEDTTEWDGEDEDSEPPSGDAAQEAVV